LVNKEIAERNEKNGTKEKPMRAWVLYSFRHTFPTRLGESGCDVLTLARIAGQSSIATSSRYVHPSEDAVLNATSRMGGHNIGHTEKSAEIPAEKEALQLTEGNGTEMVRPERFELPT
jgi:hypothetical protein